MCARDAETTDAQTAALFAWLVVAGGGAASLDGWIARRLAPGGVSESRIGVAA